MGLRLRAFSASGRSAHAGKRHGEWEQYQNTTLELPETFRNPACPQNDDGPAPPEGETGPVRHDCVARQRIAGSLSASGVGAISPNSAGVTESGTP